MLEVLRREVKYPLSTLEFRRLEPVLRACLSPDGHDPESLGYEIRSLYFDSWCDGDLCDVLAGLRNKQKIRLRGYGAQAKELKLEYKCKSGTDSVKRSLTVTRREAQELSRGRYELLEALPGDTARELHARLRMEAYQPRVVVAYRRIAYTARLNEVRVTFDFNVGASPDPAALLEEAPFFEPVTPPDIGVLELKYNNFLPGYVQSALGGLDALPAANSKYALSRLLF